MRPPARCASMGITGLLGAGLLAGCDDMSLGLDFVDGPYCYGDAGQGLPAVDVGGDARWTVSGSALVTSDLAGSRESVRSHGCRAANLRVRPSDPH